ncbi:MAG: hypothetical protein KAI57_00460 [Candidatus Pacebacteria bacterium]|nr:hypothetical protein [Candidatus Paceibacterota bacterium]
MRKEQEQAKYKKWYKKWWGILIILIFLPFVAIWYIWKKTNWDKSVKIILTILIFFFVIILLKSNDETIKQIEQLESQKITQIQKQENDEKNIEILKSINYELVESKDISFNDPNSGIVKRFNTRVLIENNPVTKKQIEILSEKIIKDYQQQKADAISIFYYFNRSQVNGAYTLAQAEWAPNGKWEEANLKQNQKTTYKFTEFIDKKRTDGPTELEREINTAMRDLWYEMMETQDMVTDEETAKILAPKYGKTVEEMLEIRRKVIDYDLGLTQ